MHRYPYDWRSKQPIIFRCTAQWFVDLEHIQKTAVEALQTVPTDRAWRSYPARSTAALQSYIAGRGEWCLSRQRHWGVPIPALYHRESGEALLDSRIVRHLAALIREDPKGADLWWKTEDIAELLPDESVFCFLPSLFSHP